MNFMISPWSCQSQKRNVHKNGNPCSASWATGHRRQCEDTKREAEGGTEKEREQEREGGRGGREKEREREGERERERGRDRQTDRDRDRKRTQSLTTACCTWSPMTSKHFLQHTHSTLQALDRSWFTMFHNVFHTGRIACLWNRFIRKKNEGMDFYYSFAETESQSVQWIWGCVFLQCLLVNNSLPSILMKHNTLSVPLIMKHSDLDLHAGWIL